jgi:hypothetical protein
MNDLSDLKNALDSPPGYAPRSLDLGEIMSVGGKLRRRRRLTVGAAGALAVVVVLIGGSRLIDSQVNSPSRTSAVPVAAAGRPDGTLGDVVPTGMSTSGGEWVFYAVPVDEKVLPETKFGFMLGVRGKAGDLTPVETTNETKGGDKAPGFHANSAAQNLGGRDTPAFGYYAGPAARIVATAHGREVAAHLTPWSEDSSIVVFWFDLKDVPAGTAVADIAAYDRTDRKLPSGSSGFGVG